MYGDMQNILCELNIKFTQALAIVLVQKTTYKCCQILAEYHN